MKDVNQLQGNFHAHITVQDIDDKFQCPSGWKLTIITLHNENRNQRDIMITRHFKTDTTKTKDVTDMMYHIDEAGVQLRKMGCQVIRKKLEHESLPTLPPSERNYRECHIKLRVPKGTKIETIPGYVISRNPMAVTEDYTDEFLNARFYTNSVEVVDKEIDHSVSCIEYLNPTCSIIEVKKETTVYDTNLQLDKWWA